MYRQNCHSQSISAHEQSQFLRLNALLRTYDYRRESDDGVLEGRIEGEWSHPDDDRCQYGDEMKVRPLKNENGVSAFSVLAKLMRKERWWKTGVST